MALELRALALVVLVLFVSCVLVLGGDADCRAVGASCQSFSCGLPLAAFWNVCPNGLVCCGPPGTRQPAASPAFNTPLTAPACGNQGRCIPTTQCGLQTNTIVHGLCRGDSTIACCQPKASGSNPYGGALQPTPAPAPVPAPVRAGRGSIVRNAQLFQGDLGQAAAFPALRQPQAVWATGYGGVSANWGSSLGVVVAYNIPGRDAGQYSAGGVASEQMYAQWIAGLIASIGSARTAVILEPDAIPQSAPGQAAAATRPARIRMLRAAVAALKAQPNIAVYIDVGHANWLDCASAASALNAIGMTQADGFSLNVSNFVPTAASLAWARCVSAKSTPAGGSAPHFVLDTSRNGGSRRATGWCNPPEAGLGRAPTTITNDPLLDAYLWIKRPGESDGNCNGAPSAGVFDANLASRLIANKA